MSLERKLAIASLVFAAIHFVGETTWHLIFGQFLPMLIVDYIAVSLLVYGAFQTLKTPSGVGLLCGAWGFEFCLNYRALFHRVDKLQNGIGIGDHAIDTTAYVLGVLMFFSVTMFLLTIWAVNRQSKEEN